MTDIPDPPPHLIAAADQELADIEHHLDRLIALWKDEQPRYAAAGLDHLGAVGAFMIECVWPRLRPTGAYACLAVAVERLARQP